MVAETLYIETDYIFLAEEAKGDNKLYEFAYNGKTYDILVMKDSVYNDGGIYIPKVEEEPENIIDNIITRIQTGDANNIFVYVFVIILLIIVLLFAIKSKKNDKE